jgi:hypothetical protein
MTLAAGLALLAALLFGTGTALQAHAAAGNQPRTRPTTRARTRAPARARTGPDTGAESVLHLRSLATVMARPLWLAGTVLDWLGALTHFAALHFGPLTLVQPLSLAAIIFAVPAEALLSRRRPSRRQMAAATQTALGLVLVALCLGRDLHSSHVDALTSGAGVAAAGFGIGVLVLCAARCRSHRLRALLLGAAAGSAYGLSDTMARAVQLPAVTQFTSVLEVSAGATALTAGGIGLLLTQAALQKSRLSSSMPAQDLLALLVSIALGGTLLAEVPHLTNTLLLGTLIALVLTAHGILRLSRTFQQPTTALDLDLDLGRGNRDPHPAATPTDEHDNAVLTALPRQDVSLVIEPVKQFGTMSAMPAPSPVTAGSFRR